MCTVRFETGGYPRSRIAQSMRWAGSMGPTLFALAPATACTSGMETLAAGAWGIGATVLYLVEDLELDEEEDEEDEEEAEEDEEEELEEEELDEELGDEGRLGIADGVE